MKLYLESMLIGTGRKSDWSSQHPMPSACNISN